MGIWALVFGGSMPIGSFWMGVVAATGGFGPRLAGGGPVLRRGSVGRLFSGPHEAGLTIKNRRCASQEPLGMCRYPSD